MRILKPVDPMVMNDDFQEMRVVAQDADSCTVKITYYPFFKQRVGENSHWRKDDAGMTKYLRPAEIFVDN